MTRIASLLVVALAVLALGANDRLSAVPSGGELTEVVVTLAAPALARAPHSAARIDAEHRAFRGELAERVPEARVRWAYRLVANGFSVVVPSGQVARLRAVPGVRDVYAAAEYAPQLDATPEQIGATALWGPGLETSGQGVKIGIVDSGVDPRHPFFDPAGYTMPAGFPKGQQTYTSPKVIVARVFAPAGARSRSARVAFDRSLDSSHGTHVAGIAAGDARTRASASQVVSGVAPGAYIGNYKVFVATETGISPNANSPAIVAAIEAAVADGMDVINFSGGQPEIEPSRDIVALALDAAAAAGVVPVVAAGNDFGEAGAGSVSSPANSTRAIAVGAVEIQGGASRSSIHAGFSSVGPTAISHRLKPDVSAPGVSVLSSVPEGWSRFSGTSMASPHVAGAAALLRHRHPTWTVDQIKSALVQTGADVVGDEGRVVGPQFQGGGLVTLSKADQPLLFAQPTGLSFGLLTRGSTARGAIRLEDAGGGAGTWQIAEVRASGSTGAASLTLPAAVEVPGELTYEVATPPTAAQGDVTGYIVLRRGVDERRVPFWGLVTAAALSQHRPGRPLPRTGVYRATTEGRPELVSRYRYPEDPSGMGVTTVLRGPELVYLVGMGQGITNFGVVVTQRGRGTTVEPRVVAGFDENRLTGYSGLPAVHNPYLESFREPVLAAGALSPARGPYNVVFDSATTAGAGAFTFRFWVNDVTPPTLRLRTRIVGRGDPVLVAATDAGSGVYPDEMPATVDGRNVTARFRRGVVRIETSRLTPGRHRLRLRVSDYQETRNHENVSRILPNTRTLAATFTVRR